MKKPTQRPPELDFNHRRHCHLGLISLVCCFCLRGLGFVRKISLVWSICFLSSWIYGFDLSLFFVFLFWVSLFFVFVFWVSLFFCLCEFHGLIFVFCLFACVRLCVSSSDFWVIFCETRVSQTNFIEIKSVILELLQWTRVSNTRDISFLNSLETMLTNKIVWKLVLFWKKKKKSPGIGLMNRKWP